MLVQISSRAESNQKSEANWQYRIVQKLQKYIDRRWGENSTMRGMNRGIPCKEGLYKTWIKHFWLLSDGHIVTTFIHEVARKILRLIKQVEK